MFDLFDHLKKRYLDNYNPFVSQSRPPNELTTPENTLVELPPPLLESLVTAIEELPTPPAWRELIHSTLELALKQWYDSPAANSLVILSSPVEPLSRLLSESLQTLKSSSQLPIQLLSWQHRPTDLETIVTKLRSHLGRGTVVPSYNQHELELVVIPNLNWCFLRCVDGLAGIEYLQELVLQDQRRFWLIGVSEMGWNYLEYVCQVQAYFERTVVLPSLTAEQLQVWLLPIVDPLDIKFSRHQSDTQDTDDRQADQKHYFERLADVSQGISAVAMQLFVRSLDYQAPFNLITTTTPKLPSLPDLTPDEHYLLYSLLLHHRLTSPHLAASLGDNKTVVQNLIQGLHHRGIIEKQQHHLNVSPIHYPKLKAELDGNNFLIH